MSTLIKIGLSLNGLIMVALALVSPQTTELVHYSVSNYLSAGQHDQPYIHYVDIEPDTAINAGYDYGIYYKLDLNGDDAIDYQFYCRSSGGVGFGSSSSSLKGLNEHNNVITTAEHPGWIKKFDHGDSITFMDEEIASEYCIYCSEFYSEWESGSSGYWWGEDPDNYTGLIMFKGGDTIMAWVKSRAGAGSLLLEEYAWMYYPPRYDTLPNDHSCELSVYPMPARDQFSIQTCLPSQECDIFLYDLSGHLITSSRLTLVRNEPATIDLGAIRAGIYVIKAILGGKTINRKIMIMR